MADPTDGSNTQWSARPTAKDRSAAQRSVNALLDVLAPEKTIRRTEPAVSPVEAYRTPNGCVLQGNGGALSVSWFPESRDDEGLGELRVTVWRGVVSRRGAAPRPDGASVTGEMTLHPIERSVDDCVWRADDGTSFDTGALVSHCLGLLEREISRPA